MQICLLYPRHITVNIQPNIDIGSMLSKCTLLAYMMKCKIHIVAWLLNGISKQGTTLQTLSYLDLVMFKSNKCLLLSAFLKPSVSVNGLIV